MWPFSSFIGTRHFLQVTFFPGSHSLPLGIASRLRVEAGHPHEARIRSRRYKGRSSIRVLVDYYEILQISPNADQETVRRVYRIQAQRFHPDNLETGNAEKFRLLADAYEVLSDPRSRAAYDAEHRRGRGQAAQEEFVVPPESDPQDEEQRREQILRLLYRKRQAHPDQPSMGLRELESHLGTPKQRLEFSLWYLKERGY